MLVLISTTTETQASSLGRLRLASLDEIRQKRSRKRPQNQRYLEP